MIWIVRAPAHSVNESKPAEVQDRTSENRPLVGAVGSFSIFRAWRKQRSTAVNRRQPRRWLCFPYFEFDV